MSPPKSGEDHEARGAWVGGSMELEDHAETMSLDGESHAPRLPHLAEGQEREVYYYQLFPNLLISLHPDYVMTHRLRPLAPDRTAVECEWLFSREAVETEGLRSFVRQRLLGHHQRPGLGRVRGRPAGRLLARLPSGSALTRGVDGGQVRGDGRQGIPGGWGRADTGLDRARAYLRAGSG